MSDTSTAVDLDGDGSSDAIGEDSDGDGVIDVVSVDEDGDGIVDTVALDTDEDGLVDEVGVDRNEDGVIDGAATDFDEDGTADLAVADLDQDGVPDPTAPAPAPAADPDLVTFSVEPGDPAYIGPEDVVGDGSLASVPAADPQAFEDPQLAHLWEHAADVQTHIADTWAAPDNVGFIDEDDLSS